MSGNRTLHREQVGAVIADGEEGEHAALWSVAATARLNQPSAEKTIKSSDSNSWMVWATGTEGSHVRGYTVTEVSLQDKQQELDASALKLQWTHTCCSSDSNLKDDQEEASGPASPSLGGSCLSCIRNYTGEDREAGDVLLLSLDLSNDILVWNLSNIAKEDDDKTSVNEEQSRISIPPVAQFTVPNATGTSAALLPPRLALTGNPTSALENVVSVAVGCLDGTVAIVSAGIPVFNPHHKQQQQSKQKIPPAGTILETWGSPNSNPAADVPLSLSWNPVQPLMLAVGSGSGRVDIFSQSSGGGVLKHFRLPHLGNEAPTRAVAFSSDGYLLMAGNDQGRLCVWDCSLKTQGEKHDNNSKQQLSSPALVHHTTAPSTSSWILQILALDERRFAVLQANQTLHIYNVTQLHAPMHTFQSNQGLWSLSLYRNSSVSNSSQIGSAGNRAAPRLVAGSDNGWLEIFSLEVN